MSNKYKSTWSAHKGHSEVVAECYYCMNPQAPRLRGLKKRGTLRPAMPTRIKLPRRALLALARQVFLRLEQAEQELAAMKLKYEHGLIQPVTDPRRIAEITASPQGKR